MRGYYCYYCFHGCLSLPITRAGLRSGWCGRRWQHSLHSTPLYSSPLLNQYLLAGPRAAASWPDWARPDQGWISSLSSSSPPVCPPESLTIWWCLLVLVFISMSECWEAGWLAAVWWSCGAQAAPSPALHWPLLHVTLASHQSASDSSPDLEHGLGKTIRHFSPLAQSYFSLIKSREKLSNVVCVLCSSFGFSDWIY